MHGMPAVVCLTLYADILSIDSDCHTTCRLSAPAVTKQFRPRGRKLSTELTWDICDTVPNHRQELYNQQYDHQNHAANLHAGATQTQIFLDSKQVRLYELFDVPCLAAKTTVLFSIFEQKYSGLSYS